LKGLRLFYASHNNIDIESMEFVGHENIKVFDVSKNKTVALPEKLEN
jgi:hypothetical protein